METETLDGSATGTGTTQGGTDGGSSSTSSSSSTGSEPPPPPQDGSSGPSGSTGASEPSGSSTGSGSSDGAGTGVDFGNACPDVYDPVCGEDGETYDNACSVPAGVEIKREGPCFGDCEGSCSVSGEPLTLAMVLVAALVLRPRRR